MDNAEHLASIYRNTQGVPISLNMAAKILHRGKAKVRSLIGTRIKLVEGVDNNSYSLDLADVLNIVGKNI